MQKIRADLKNWARGKVSAAIKSGELVRGACEVCGSRDDVEGHHENYEEPLKVRWLCIRHHKAVHAKVAEYGGEGVVNIRGVDRSLMRAMKLAALESGRTLRDWVIWVWSVNVGWETRDGEEKPRRVQRARNSGVAVGEVDSGEQKGASVDADEDVRLGSVVESVVVEGSDWPKQPDPSELMTMSPSEALRALREARFKK